MAIDLGTGSCRAVVFDESGRQKAIAQREWSHRPLTGVPGSQDFDTATNWRLICECTREAIATSGGRPDLIRAISSTSMREGIVLYDRQGREVWACPNVDSRAGVEAGELVRTGAARRIYGIGGDWVAITSPPRLLWIRRHLPDVFRSIAHMTMLSDWVLFKLSGQFATDPSCGSSSNMFDLAGRTWSPEIVTLSGLPLDVLPNVVESGTVLGEVTGPAASESGLAQGTLVVMGGADTQLGLVGIGRTRPGGVTIVGGSFWQTTILLDHPLIDPEARLRTLCHAVTGQWMVEGIGFYHGIVMRWFRDAFCDWEKDQAARRGLDAYAVMEEAASTVPAGSNGVVGVFSNLMDAKRWIHASPSFLQFDVRNPVGSGRKECIRAIEESAAYTTYGHLAVIQELTQSRCSEVVLTGGASKGRLWPQILADVLGVAVHLPAIKESTSLGAAVYAALGAGLYRNLDEVLGQLVQFERTVEPDLHQHDAYLEFYQQWRAIYSHQLRLVEEGLLRPLWRAAGT